MRFRLDYQRDNDEILLACEVEELAHLNEGLTDNFLSLTFGRNKIQYLRNYLYLIIEEIDKEDSQILEMLEKGILVKSYS